MTEPDVRTVLIDLVERDQAPLLARRFFGDGPASPITASLAHVPELLEVALPFIGAALGPGTLGPRMKEIAILRTSALLECRYCVQSHTAVALDAGLSAGEVRALRRKPRSSSLSPPNANGWRSPGSTLSPRAAGPWPERCRRRPPRTSPTTSSSS